MALTARDIMTTQVITVTPSTPVTEFARICTEDEISGAPVVRVDGQLVGIVSKTDLIERLLEDHPRYGGGASRIESDRDEEHQVADIMNEEPATVPPDLTLDLIAAEMVQRRIHRVLVTQGGKLLGIITSLDVLARYGQ